MASTLNRPNQPNQYTHILFDHDGVLVDTEPLYYRATRECLAQLGVDLALSEYLERMTTGASSWDLARRQGARESDIEYWHARRNVLYQDLLASEPIDIEGVEEALARLGKHLGLAIVTTALPEDFAIIHRNRNIVRHVDFVLTRDAYRRSKPHPDPYLAALERFGIGPDCALAVEDSERGLRAAVAAGMDCAVVHNAFTAGQDFSSASFRIEGLGELVDRILDAPSQE
ncbi:MAG: HAD family phosphatase [Gammaproteobacteria bacterium]|nr:HAD family phosphatase [Gammaproteobacteria bacterium]MDE0366923.1 HAD family phosphatase [Gammaproteobacteria bacterium]